MAEFDPKKVQRFMEDHGTGSYEQRKKALEEWINKDGFAPDPPICTYNDHLVGLRDNNRIVIGSLGQYELDKAQALRMAAWIVALADPLDEHFHNLLEAVMKS